MEFKLNDWKPNLTDEEIIEDINKVANKLGVDYISLSTYKREGKYSQSAISGHFGTWKNALQIAGLRVERSKDELKVIKDEDYAKDLIRVAKLNNKDTVTYEEYKRDGKYSNEHIFDRFGGLWDNALEFAGLKPTGLARHKITEQEVLEEIERIWILLGRQPTSTDIIKKGISKYSLDTFKRRFGGWRKALEAFVEWVNRDNRENNEKNNSNVSEASVKLEEPEVKRFQRTNHIDQNCSHEHRTSRNVNLRLRFKVMQRDNFTCVKCGASPAKDQNVVLQVDHIIPWSKGGETEIDNLQTLCEKCNLGKSDLTMK